MFGIQEYFWILTTLVCSSQLLSEAVEDYVFIFLVALIERRIINMLAENSHFSHKLKCIIK